MNASELFQNWMPDLTGQLDNIFNYVFKGAVMSSVKKRSVKGGCPLNGLTRPKRHNVHNENIRGGPKRGIRLPDSQSRLSYPSYNLYQENCLLPLAITREIYDETNSINVIHI
jgi:hypothetical protein